MVFQRFIHESLFSWNSFYSLPSFDTCKIQNSVLRLFGRDTLHERICHNCTCQTSVPSVSAMISRSVKAIIHRIKASRLKAKLPSRICMVVYVLYIVHMLDVRFQAFTCRQQILMCAFFTEIELVCTKFLKISQLALSIYNIHQTLFCQMNHCSGYWSCCTKSLQMSLRISHEGCFFSTNLACDITSTETVVLVHRFWPSLACRVWRGTYWMLVPLPARIWSSVSPSWELQVHRTEEQLSHLYHWI